jgi:hypothetical protein
MNGRRGRETEKDERKVKGERLMKIERGNTIVHK